MGDNLGVSPTAMGAAVSYTNTNCLLVLCARKFKATFVETRDDLGGVSHTTLGGGYRNIQKYYICDST